MRHAITAVLIGIGLMSTAGAATLYVSDQLIINLRTGAGNQYRIVERVPTGTPLEVLDEADRWAQVRTPDGDTGWVRSQYLMPERPAQARLEEAQAEVERLGGENEELRGSLQQAEQELTGALDRIEELTAERDELAQQVERAREGLTLSEENNRLKKEVIDLERRIQDLANETERLSDRNRQDWFMVGAGVLFAGMLVGITVTRIRWRRRSTWGDL